MAVGMNIAGGLGGVLADVSQYADGVKRLAVAAGTTIIADGDGGAFTSTESGAMRTSIDQLLFFEQVDGSAINTNVWNYSSSGMTVAQANGFITLNAGQAVTANAWAILQSVKYFQLMGAMPTRPVIRLKWPAAPQANATVEIGIGTVATNTTPTDGVFLRGNSSGEWRAVLNNGGSETTALIDPALMPAPGNVILFECDIVEDLCRFRVNDIGVATVPVPAGLAYPTNAGKLTIFVRVYNGSSPPNQAPQISIGQFLVVGQDMNGGESYDDLLMTLGRGGYQARVSPFGSLNNIANNTSPVTIAAGALSNTVAAYSKIGGAFALAGFASNTGNDFIVFAYQVPAGDRLKIRGVRIDTAILGTAIVTATLLEWWMGVNASAASLATADSPPTTWAPRPIWLGSQGFVALAGIGVQATAITQRWEFPIVVDSGRWLTINVRCPTGAATASLIYRGGVQLDCLHV